ncbi:MAG: aminodeoxychorismate synthase component I [Verrucomicrobia bacterium]|nr:aminodeoxychorismate synthase component I [Verrucomicrobiota bacterium]
MAEIFFTDGSDALAAKAFVDGQGPNACGEGAWIFGRPIGLIEAHTDDELESACNAIDQASDKHHVILLVDYEVGSWFEPKLKIPAEGHTWAPLQGWIYQEAEWLPQDAFEYRLAEIMAENGANRQPTGVAALQAEINELEYSAAVRSALEYIAAGETYQVNLTFRTDFIFFGSPLALYQKLRRSQPVNHGVYLQVPGRTILSRSPELFLQRQGDRVIARPMKGTAPRFDNDRAQAEALGRSEKDRAENLMIVDLIRNDLGKIALTGSVRVDDLFRIEEYPTVYQMVSEVSARIQNRSLYRTLEALFPSGSVTGAPKLRAMTTIRELEPSPRGIYTGTIGYIRPGGDFSLNVAIRTIELTTGNRGRMHVGSGIVADSKPETEYAECWSKARFLTELASDFMLLETLLIDSGKVPRLEAHLQRLKQSAQFFGFKYNEAAIREAILCHAAATPKDRRRLRLTVDQHSQIETQIQPLAPLPMQLECVIASKRTNSADPLLRHKTTARKLYDDTLGKLEANPTIFDALFFNERDELTEGARSNVFLVKCGVWSTPVVESGLLSGVMRQEILNTHKVFEKKLHQEDLISADAVYLSNSLRGLARVILADYSP